MTEPTQAIITLTVDDTLRVSVAFHPTASQDLSGARDLAARGREDKNYYFEFEKWALS